MHTVTYFKAKNIWDNITFNYDVCYKVGFGLSTVIKLSLPKK